MKDIEMEKALEQVNAEYLKMKNQETEEYVLGRRLLNLKKNFPFHFVRWLKRVLRNRDIKKKSESISTRVKDEDLYYASPKEVSDVKGVVYTCITSGYDDPYEPIYKSEDLQYILFTDKQCMSKTSKWKYCSLGDMVVEKDSNKVNRFFKFHPFDLFEGKYDYSIYIDGNVQTVSDVAPLYSVAKDSKLGIAMHRHATRSCAYKDALWCKYNNRGNQRAIIKQLQDYRAEGFPENFGLCEATIIVVDLHNETAKLLLSKWWKEFCRSESGRDQISFPYILWKEGYNIEDVGDLGNDEYRNPKFRINEHKGKAF